MEAFLLLACTAAAIVIYRAAVRPFLRYFNVI